jgi:hypothetical protein
MVYWRMSINAKQLQSYVIVPTLVRLGLYSDAAVNLLLLTCAQESEMGEYLKQINGPALGIYQMEPPTHDDIWNNYLVYQLTLKQKVLDIDKQNSINLITNLAYATAMARIDYLREPAPLPTANDIQGLAHYYKRYYNTDEGAATVEEVVANYQRYVNA